MPALLPTLRIWEKATAWPFALCRAAGWCSDDPLPLDLTEILFMPLNPHAPCPSASQPEPNSIAPWTCWVCGDTHTPTGEPLTTAGQRIKSHLRAHLLEGLVRPATPVERATSKVFCVLTSEGEAFAARRRLDPSTPRPPALPLPGTRSRQVYDVIAEFPGVRLLAVEIADECGLPLQLASAFAHHLARRGVVKIETGGRGRQAEFWVEA